MDRLDVEIVSADRGLPRRLRKLRRPPLTALGMLTPSQLVTGAVIAAVAYLLLATPSVHIRGMTVTAANILLLVDNSPSMVRYQNELRSLRRQFQQRGVTIRKEATFFFFETSGGRNLVDRLAEELPISKGIDTILVVSDFVPGQTSNTPEGYQRFEELLHQFPLKLYFYSVGQEIPPRHAEIATGTGGSHVVYEVPVPN